MNCKKVVLIVDNPIRDLYGQILLATKLVDRGIRVYLISMNELYINNGRDLWCIAPDFILLNYLRKNNQEIVKNIIKSNINFGILDTEGGVLTNLKSYKDIFLDDINILKSVNTYFSWGKKLADYLISEKYLTKDQIELTGSPRFDFYSAPLNIIHSYNKSNLFNNINPVILINCNFPIANPQFQTKEEEKSFLINVLKFREKKVLDMIRCQEDALLQFIEITKKLSKLYLNVNFILRPHPFENENIYKQNLHSYQNVVVSKEGPVINQIAISKCILHRNCSTAIESQLLNIPSISLKWVNVFEEQPLPESVSISSDNFENLLKYIDQTLSGNNINTIDIKNNLKTIEDNWFTKFDGKSSNRVADKILKILQQKSSINFINLKKIHNSSIKYSFKERARGIIFLFLGLSENGSLKIKTNRKKSDLTLNQKSKLFFIYLLNLSKNNKYFSNKHIENVQLNFNNSEKYFDINKVKKITEEISNILNIANRNINIRYANNDQDFVFNNSLSKTIVLEKL
jgi:surface carbohydrate biosynthesis protein